jgi:hypothetical protein
LAAGGGLDDPLDVAMLHVDLVVVGRAERATARLVTAGEREHLEAVAVVLLRRRLSLDALGMVIRDIGEHALAADRAPHVLALGRHHGDRTRPSRRGKRRLAARG